MKRKEIRVGEWELDKYGRKFRRVGNAIEYAPEIMTTGGIVRADDLEAHNERMKQERERQEQERREKREKEPKGRCPLKHSTIVKCESTCVLYDGSGCMLASGRAETDTAGKTCPFTGGQCNDVCMLYVGGCMIVERLRKGNL